MEYGKSYYELSDGEKVRGINCAFSPVLCDECVIRDKCFILKKYNSLVTRLQQYEGTPGEFST